MTGAWHFREAERLLNVANTCMDNTRTPNSAGQESALKQAAVHAQLANVAALVEGRFGYKDDEVDERWNHVLYTRTLFGEYIPRLERGA